MKSGTFRTQSYKEKIEKEQIRRARLREKLREQRNAKKFRKLQKIQKKRAEREKKKLPNVLKEICHDWIKIRDSFENETRKGKCITCGRVAEGQDFQAGHWFPSSTCGIILRYHPQNIHGQCGRYCNGNRNHQQKMGMEYTIKMVDKYGSQRVKELQAMKVDTVYTPTHFFETMIELYKKGDEQEIIAYLEYEYKKHLEIQEEIRIKNERINSQIPASIVLY
jgi:hypothetical protein